MDLFRDLCCSAFARKTAEDLAEQYGGQQGRAMAGMAFSEDNELVNSLLGSFTGKQQLSLQHVMSLVSSSGGEQLREHAEQKGLDPALLNGVMSLVKGGGGGGGDASEGDSGGGGGMNFGNLLQVVSSLTKEGGAGGGVGADGFLQLLGGLGGGGDGKGFSMESILQILQGLAKSYFNVKAGSSSAIQGWDAAGAGQNANDRNFLSWALSVIMDLLFPGKKPKDIIEEGKDDNIDPGKKKKDDNVKGWFDGHPEIGKMQKDIFDDIFDTKDDDVTDDNDPAPLVPTPTDFQDGCTCLDNAAILFINTNLLLEYRKNWRFLYSSKTHARSLDEMVSLISYKGPTILVVRDTAGRLFGGHASTSWCDTQGGWLGNGECFLFSIQPKMAVFHATGKDEHFQALSSDYLAMGGSKGTFGLQLDADLNGGTCSGDIQTFHTIQLSDASFQIDHVEVWGLGPEPDPARERELARPRRPNLTTRGGGAVDLDDLESQLM